MDPKHSERTDALRRRLSAQLTDDEDLTLMKAVQVLKRLEQGEDFHVVNIVSHTTGKGRLDVSWMGMLAQIDPAQGREIGWMLLEAASIAETEAAVVRFMKERVGLDADRAGMLLQDFRKYREADPQSSLVGNKPQ